MGRHSSPEASAYLRSLAAWFVPWFLVAAVAGVAVWIALDALQGPLEARPPAPDEKPAAAASPERTESAAPESPAPAEPSPSPSPTRSPEPKPTQDDEPKQGLITRGITVQVLNAANAPGLEDAMGARLESLGYRVVVTGQAAAVYERTTVFWSNASARPAAKALAERFRWVARRKPANLSSSVSMHVVVGTDET